MMPLIPHIVRYSSTRPPPGASIAVADPRPGGGQVGANPPDLTSAMALTPSAGRNSLGPRRDATFLLPHCPFFAPRELFDYYFEQVDVPQPTAEELARQPAIIKKIKKRDLALVEQWTLATQPNPADPVPDPKPEEIELR